MMMMVGNRDEVFALVFDIVLILYIRGRMYECNYCGKEWSGLVFGNRE